MTRSARACYCLSMDIRVRNIDPELRTAFKLTTIANGTTMNEVIIRLIEEYVKREKKAPYKVVPRT